jgi:anaerobic ribonucleoside-triphosphate reductase activating protein
MSTSHRSLVISGGEPTLHAGLLPFLRILREQGISIKLDTNGTSPDMLERILAEGLVDFVAMDLKASLGKYRQVAGRKVDTDKIRQSAELIKTSGVAHQFRTTLVPDLVDIEDLVASQRLAGGNGRLTVQRFRCGGSNLHRKFRQWREHSQLEFDGIIKQLEAQE